MSLSKISYLTNFRGLMMTAFKIIFRLLTLALLLNIFLALYLLSPIIFSFGFSDYGIAEQEVGEAVHSGYRNSGDNASSHEQRTLGFIRIHKTGSTTFLGILFR